jgi:hypothetical protein
MPMKSYIHKRCGTLKKKLFSTRGYAEIHIQRQFLTIKKAYQKLLYWKSKQWEHAFQTNACYGHPNSCHAEACDGGCICGLGTPRWTLPTCVSVI